METFLIEMYAMTYTLSSLLKEELKNGSNDLVTRSTGQTIRDRIERDIAKEKDGAVIAIDFSGIGVIDYSCADEIVAKLISRLISGEYGDKYIVLTGLNENQKENIEVALERKVLAVIAEIRGNGKVLIGSLNNYLIETHNLIFEKGSVTANDLSDTLKLPANTSGTRLLNLHKKRLVKRVPERRNDGTVWVYEKI
ncbi:MAG: STAS-like domain-containing protein [Proteobacteria bacterium]|nr:STAS-like domain-containing protein [Pseudomonadota bacterium]